MKNQNPIYIKLSSSEAITLKRNMLLTQIISIRIAKTIKNFNKLRQQELTLKESLQKTLKESKQNIKKIEHLLPKVTLPKSLKKDDDEDDKKEGIKEEPINYEINLDEQLKEIQNRLNSLN